MRFAPHLLGLMALVISFQAEARRFTNAYVSFDLPPSWNCNLEATEWVCTSEFQPKAKEAIIILTAKQVGPADSLDAFTNHLKTVRNVPSQTGTNTPSKIVHVQNRNVGGHPWVDGLHLGSEVGSYYTRYLVTMKEGIAILVTFSAHKAHYTKYSQDFLRAIDSLRVVATKDLLARSSSEVRAANETIGAAIQPHMTNMMGDMPEEPGGGGGGNSWLMNFFLLLVVLAAVGGYILIKRREKLQAKKKPKGPAR